MRPSSILRIWRRFSGSRRPKRQGRKTRRGTATLVALSLFMIFSAIGLSLVFLTQVVLRCGAFKKNTAILDLLAENGLKLGYEALAAPLTSRPFPVPLDELRLAILKSDAENRGMALLQEALGQPLPQAVQGGWENHAWEGSVHIALRRFEDQDSYFAAEYRAAITSQGKLAGQRLTRSSSLDVSLDVVAGFVPLALFPALLAKADPDSPPAEPPLPGSLVFQPGPGRHHLAQLLVTEEPLLPRDAVPALEDTLKIKLFSPQDLTPRRLRRALDLEESDDPVPDGVYLVRNDLGLGGVYVQGDLEELIFAIEEEWQVICFRTPEAEWTLKFSPVRCRTEFTGPGFHETFNLLPATVIIVDGAVKALGGGKAAEGEKLRLCPEEEIPSILCGVRMTLVSSGRITLAAHLLQQGVTWQSGIPYIEESDSQLFIYSTGRGVTSGTEAGGGISVASDAPRELKVQAELVASGSGFRVEGGDKNIHLLGSLQATDIHMNGNHLAVSSDPGLLRENDLARRLLRTAAPVLLLTSLKPLVWRDRE